MPDSGTHGPDPLRDANVSRLVVFAPNWLGDAVMALPALADVQRARPGTAVTVAARPSVAPLFGLVAGVAEVIALDSRPSMWGGGSPALAQGRFDAALLMPNSFYVARIARSAGIRERWGYATQGRGWLLTRRVPPPSRLHQAAYYQHLTRSLGFAPGPLVPILDLLPAQRAVGAELLRSAGWDGRAPFVVFAPGAAYGGAKRWPAASFAAVATDLGRAGLTAVIIGSGDDARSGADMLAALDADATAINLIGRTDLLALAGVLVASRGLITNDSGAMHLAAALGVPVTAVFGPTDEAATHPLGRAPARIMTHAVWCRPCMLRECPLDRRCMTGISPESVASAARSFA
jgi:heptosyltransferase II